MVKMLLDNKDNTFPYIYIEFYSKILEYEKMRCSTSNSTIKQLCDERIAEIRRRMNSNEL